MNISKYRWKPEILSLVAIVYFVFWTSLIGGWGSWYSNHLALRLQTEAMLHGHLALSKDLGGLGWDLAWGSGGVQQIWGLGVPLLRLPFEAVAKAIGQGGFPDRFVFIILLAAVTYIIMRVHFELGSKNGAPADWSWGFLGLIPTILFPPFVGLCASRFSVYEEVSAYSVVMGLLVMAWTAWVWLVPSRASFLGLAFVSGLLCLVRPTIGVYGFASIAVASLAVWQKERGWRVVGLAFALFAVGIGLQLWTNAVRFGAPLEFGHSLAVNGLPPMGYVARFDNPYHTEPLISAARELLGFLFFGRTVNAVEAYNPGEFPGQSDTFRWRESYFTTYDWSILIIAILVLAWFARRLYRFVRARQGLGQVSVLDALALWLVLAAAPLVLFYLRFPFISSRYMLDFGPAFAAGFYVLVIVAATSISIRHTAAWLRPVFISVLAVWWGCELVTTKQYISGQEKDRTVSWKKVSSRLKDYQEHLHDYALPASYTSMGVFKAGIPFDGSGWDGPTGKVWPAVTLFVDAPEFLKIEVQPADGPALSEHEYDCIRAKVGLEFLNRKSITATTNGMTIVFRGPKNKQFQTGLQIASLSMVNAHELRDEFSKFRLLKVSWHDDAASSAARPDPENAVVHR